jgi:hypothetical protein
VTGRVHAIEEVLPPWLGVRDAVLRRVPVSRPQVARPAFDWGREHEREHRDAEAAKLRQKVLYQSRAFLRFNAALGLLEQQLESYKRSCKPVAVGPGGTGDTYDVWFDVVDSARRLALEAEMAIELFESGKAMLDERPLRAAVEFFEGKLGVRVVVDDDAIEVIDEAIPDVLRVRGASDWDGVTYDEKHAPWKTPRVRSKRKHRDPVIPAGFDDALFQRRRDEAARAGDKVRLLDGSEVALANRWQEKLDKRKVASGWLVAVGPGGIEDVCVRELVTAHDVAVRDRSAVDLEGLVAQHLRALLATAGGGGSWKKQAELWSAALAFVLGVWTRTPSRHRPRLNAQLDMVRTAVEAVGAPFPRRLGVAPLRLVAGDRLQRLSPGRGGGPDRRKSVAAAVDSLREEHQDHVDKAARLAAAAAFAAGRPACSARQLAAGIGVHQMVASELLECIRKRPNQVLRG